MLSNQEIARAAASLDRGESVEVRGMHLVAEGAEWLLTRPDGSRETTARYGHESNGITASELVDYADRLAEGDPSNTMTRWEDLIVTDEDGNATETLGALVETDPERLNDAVLDSEGRIAEWEGFFLSAPGEEPDFNTPAEPVNWTGFQEKLDR